MSPHEIDALLATWENDTVGSMLEWGDQAAAAIRALRQERDQAFEKGMLEGADQILEQDEHVRAERDAAREFFWRCWDGARGVTSEPDGGEIQEWGEELGLLKKVVRDAPCGEGCVCDEMGADFPTDCYVPAFGRAATAPAEDPK
jgi:hypothetical protein